MSIKLDPNSVVDKKFLGIPYELGKRGFDGADCIGVAILWLADQGIQYEYDDSQGPVMAHWWEHNPKRFLDAFLSLGSIIRWPELKKYDCLLLLGDEVSSYPSCMGIMVDDRHFLTSLKDGGSFVSMLSLDWKQKFWSAIRLRKIEESISAR